MNTRRYSKFLIGIGTCLILLVIVGTSAKAKSGDTTRVSVASDGTQGNSSSEYASISADGRYVAFQSNATNLVNGGTSGTVDIFVNDRETGHTEIVSVDSNGMRGNSGSGNPSISADGRLVAFESQASNLVSGDTNATDDIFVHDRQTGQTELVSVASDGTQGNSYSLYSPISADGRYVAFQSNANNLVSGDTNGVVDIFVHDRQTGQTTRVSVASDGTQGNAYSQASSISADGRYVAFYSNATNLVSDDTNGVDDIFVHDLQTGQTERVSVASDGTQANGSSSDFPSISADGRYVVFQSNANNLVSGDMNGTTDIFVHDQQTGETTLVSEASDGTQGNGYSDHPFISGDGRYVAFESQASNLVSGDTNGNADIFVHDLLTGETTLASVSSDGTKANYGGFSRYPSVSVNGRYVAFWSSASNLVSGDTNGATDVFVHENDFPPMNTPSDLTATTISSSQIDLSWTDNSSDETTFRIELSLDGSTNWIEIGTAAANNTSYSSIDLWECTPYYYRVRAYRASDYAYSFYSNIATATTTGCLPTARVSIASDGTQGNGESYFPSISSDGRYVVFWSSSSNLVSGDTNGASDVFIHDRQTDLTSLVSVASDGAQGNTNSGIPSLSPSGRYVAFVSTASNLVYGDTNGYADIFVHDMLTDLTRRVSVASDGTQANASSNYPSISADGRYVAFESSADNLVGGDTNGYADIFVHDMQTGQTWRVSVASDGTQGNFNSSASFISADGRYVAFESRASNLVDGDTNGSWDIFVHDLVTNQTERVSLASDGTQGNSDSAATPSISADGRYIAFLSDASNLVSGDTNGKTDIFVHDRLSGQTTRASVASDGSQGNSDSDQPSISADGHFVAFHSFANNLVSGDTNGLNDVFIHDLQTGRTSRVSVDSDGVQGNLDSLNNNSSISANGHYVAFISASTNLVNGDTNGMKDIFVHENDVPTCIISGDAGVAGATLSYDDGGLHTSDAYGNGYYFLEVSKNWSGTVTPSKQNYSFSPINRPYTNVLADHTSQDYIATTFRVYLPIVIR